MGAGGGALVSAHMAPFPVPVDARGWGVDDHVQGVVAGDLTLAGGASGEVLAGKRLA